MYKRQDYTHPDLAGAMWENPGTLDLPGRHGYDFANDDDDPMPAGEHGTHVAGIAAAVANNGIGGAGVAPNAKIMAFRIADENGGLWESAAISAYAYMKQAVQEMCIRDRRCACSGRGWWRDILTVHSRLSAEVNSVLFGIISTKK